MKLLLEFVKGPEVRWLGHLDVQRVFERALRRSRLPVAYSQGYNPRHRMAFVSALGLGLTGSAELLMVEFVEAVAPTSVVSGLNDVLPVGCSVRSARTLDDAEAKRALAEYDTAEYIVECTTSEPADSVALSTAVASLLAESSIPYTRTRGDETKQTDLRQYLRSMSVLECTNTRALLGMTMRFGPAGSARPSELVDVMAPIVPGLRHVSSHRVRISASGMGPPATDGATTERR